MLFKLHFGLILFSAFGFLQKNPNKTFEIKGRISQSASYCGGMRLSDEMMQQYTKEKAYPNKVFYVKKGKTNDPKQKIILKITGDSAGRFSFRLAPGDYVLLQAEQITAIDYKALSKLEYIQFDKNCLEQWWRKPYMLLNVRDQNISDLHFHFHHQCFVPGDMPCLRYSGPMPP